MSVTRNPRITVGELIAQLSRLDPTIGVVVAGYEGGYSSPRIDEIDTYTERDADGLFGEFEDDEDGDYRAVYLDADPPCKPTRLIPR